MSLARSSGLFFFPGVLAICLCAGAQDNTAHRGRKYKVPPPTSHVQVLVLKDNNSKPVANAAVVFHPVKDGHDEGNLEVKTNEDGKADIDVIPTGSLVGVQIIADGFATYAGDYQVDEADRAITIRMVKPRAQISTYQDTHGQASTRAAGVQEPSRPTTPAVIQPLQSVPGHLSDPSPLAPVDPNATPGNSQNQTRPTGDRKSNGVPPQ